MPRKPCNMKKYTTTAMGVGKNLFGSSLLHMGKFDRYSPGMFSFCCSKLFEGRSDR